MQTKTPSHYLASGASLALMAIGCTMVATSALGIASPRTAIAAETATAANASSSVLPVRVNEDAPTLARGVTAAPTEAPASSTVTPVVSTPAEELLKFTIVDSVPRLFTTSGETLPKANVAVSRAMSYVGNAAAACDDGKCENECDHLSGAIWGYRATSGYETALTHWDTAVATGIAHPGDRNVPLGAILFFTTGAPEGHVMTYVGNGMAVSNFGNGPAGSGVYLLPADYFERTRGNVYLGWAMPVYHGEAVGAAL